jgi:probable phosphoglycerate mutase
VLLFAAGDESDASRPRQNDAMPPREYRQEPYERPAGSTELVLVRHGASATLRAGGTFPLLEGHSDPPLAPEGGAQAQAVAGRLAHEPFAGVFVSPLRRTAETAAPLVAATGLEPTPVPDLREVFLGDWEGGIYRVRLTDADPLALRMLAEERWDLIPNAEPAEAFAARIRSGVDAVVAATGPDAAAAVFLHGGVLGEICRQATGSRPFAFIHADNGSITRLVVMGAGRWRIRSFNDTAHLGQNAVTARPSVPDG